MTFFTSHIDKIIVVVMIFIAHNLIAKNLKSSDFNERYISFSALDLANPKHIKIHPKIQIKILKIHEFYAQINQNFHQNINPILRFCWGFCPHLINALVAGVISRFYIAN